MGLHACLKLLLKISIPVHIHSSNPGSNFDQQTSAARDHFSSSKAPDKGLRWELVLHVSCLPPIP